MRDYPQTVSLAARNYPHRLSPSGREELPRRLYLLQRGTTPRTVSLRERNYPPRLYPWQWGTTTPKICIPCKDELPRPKLTLAEKNTSLDYIPCCEELPSPTKLYPGSWETTSQTVSLAKKNYSQTLFLLKGELPPNCTLVEKTTPLVFIPSGEKILHRQYPCSEELPLLTISLAVKNYPSRLSLAEKNHPLPDIPLLEKNNPSRLYPLQRGSTSLTVFLAERT